MARIRPLVILTADGEKLVRFYTTAFRLKIVQGISTAAYLSDGQINLAIIPIGPEGKIEGPDLKPGLYHVGFEVEDVAALRDLCKELDAATGIDNRPANRKAPLGVVVKFGQSVGPQNIFGPFRGLFPHRRLIGDFRFGPIFHKNTRLGQADRRENLLAQILLTDSKLAR